MLSHAQITLKNRKFTHKAFLWKKSLGVNFDYKLNFAKHIENIFQETPRQLSALARLTLHMT